MLWDIFFDTPSMVYWSFPAGQMSGFDFDLFSLVRFQKHQKVPSTNFSGIEIKKNWRLIHDHLLRWPIFSRPTDGQRQFWAVRSSSVFPSRQEIATFPIFPRAFAFHINFQLPGLIITIQKYDNS